MKSFGELGGQFWPPAFTTDLQTPPPRATADTLRPTSKHKGGPEADPERLVPKIPKCQRDQQRLP